MISAIVYKVLKKMEKKRERKERRNRSEAELKEGRENKIKRAKCNYNLGVDTEKEYQENSVSSKIIHYRSFARSTRSFYALFAYFFFTCFLQVKTVCAISL